jgi:hypothetical protein
VTDPAPGPAGPASGLERRDRITFGLSLAGLVIALATAVLGFVAYFQQRDQIEALQRTTPTGHILPFTTNGTISHETAPLNIDVEAENVPVNGRLWIVNHKPFARAGGRADRYYPTEVELHGDGRLVASMVYIGTPADSQAVTYELGLYFCDSVDSNAMQSFLNSDKRSEGLPTITGASCRQLDGVRVTRAGDG